MSKVLGGTWAAVPVSVDMVMVGAAPAWGQGSRPLTVKGEEEEGSRKARRCTEPLSSPRWGVLKAAMPLAAEKLVLPTTFPSYHLASKNKKEQKVLN